MGEKDISNRWVKQKTNNKMVATNPSISAITSNTNGRNMPIKTVSEWIFFNYVFTKRYTLYIKCLA